MPAIVSSASSSGLIHAIECDPLKQNSASGHLYVCQPHMLQIIQLVECPPPSPRAISAQSPSTCPTSTDSEEDCSSYCSSVVTPDESSHDREPIPWTDDTFDMRMKRVHAWRDHALCGTESLKRKTKAEDDDASPSSKRARSRDGVSRIDGHPCPACDVVFPSRASLDRHGHEPDTPEACRIAVEYDLE